MADSSEVCVLLLGDSGVGKSTFLSRLTAGIDARGPLPRLHDLDQPFCFDIQQRREGKTVRLEFFDTASSSTYLLLQPAVIVLCFSIADPTSLTSLQTTWRKVVETNFNANEMLPVIVLGLQRDIRTKEDYDGRVRQPHQRPTGAIVYPQQGLHVAQTMRCDRYCECSAMSGDLCREVFEDIAKTAMLTTTEAGGRTAGTYCSVM